MSTKKPHRHEIAEEAFPVRLQVLVDPETHHVTNRWLTRHIGEGNYASAPRMTRGGQRAVLVYFATVHDALMFLAGCPHIRLYGEAWHGTVR